MEFKFHLFQMDLSVCKGATRVDLSTMIIAGGREMIIREVRHTRDFSFFDCLR